MRRAIARVGISVLVALGLSAVVGVGGAQAAGECWSGYSCFWQGKNFTGAKYGVSLNSGTLALRLLQLDDGRAA